MLPTEKERDLAVPQGETLAPAQAEDNAHLEAGMIDESEVEALATEDKDDTTVAPSLGLDHDMEAAMEEDIAGETTGVSRRNPELPSSPAMGLYSTPIRPARTQMRSGVDEADWFNRFRQRLASDNEPMHTNIATSEQETTEFADSGGMQDEAENYSEDG